MIIRKLFTILLPHFCQIKWFISKESLCAEMTIEALVNVILQVCRWSRYIFQHIFKIFIDLIFIELHQFQNQPLKRFILYHFWCNDLQKWFVSGCGYQVTIISSSTKNLVIAVWLRGELFCSILFHFKPRHIKPNKFKLKLIGHPTVHFFNLS